MRRSLKKRVERLESGGNGGEDGFSITISMTRVDENGAPSGVVEKNRYGFDENGEWYSERIEGGLSTDR